MTDLNAFIGKMEKHILSWVQARKAWTKKKKERKKIPGETRGCKKARDFSVEFIDPGKAPRRKREAMNYSYASSLGCEGDLFIGRRLQHPSPVTMAALIVITIINILSFPFTAILNALVMLAVKSKSRLRAHKTNILLALLASTEFVVGVVVQPIFIAGLVMLLLGKPSEFCLSRVLRPAWLKLRFSIW